MAWKSPCSLWAASGALNASSGSCGVYSTAAGYTGGYTPNPTYREVCSGETGHAEAVRIVYDPTVISYEQLLQVFWENHDPAQGMRQGNDHGTQYRSAIYPLTPEQDAAARASLERFQQAMREAGDTREVTTEITTAKPFYYAEDDHQQYLHKTRTATAESEVSASACRHSWPDYQPLDRRPYRAAPAVRSVLCKNVTSGRFTSLYAILAAEIIGSTLRADVQCVSTQMVSTPLLRIWREAG